MLTSFNAPHVSRFLEELGQDGIAQLSGFDWGPAFAATFLPRVTRGRAILAPAQWRLSERVDWQEVHLNIGVLFSVRRFPRALARPPLCTLVEGDNRLCYLTRTHASNSTSSASISPAAVSSARSCSRSLARPRARVGPDHQRPRASRTRCADGPASGPPSACAFGCRHAGARNGPPVGGPSPEPSATAGN